MELSPLLPLLIGLISGILSCYQMRFVPAGWVAGIWVVAVGVAGYFVHQRLRPLAHFFLGVALALLLAGGMKVRMELLARETADWRWQGELVGKIVESDPHKIVLTTFNAE